MAIKFFLLTETSFHASYLVTEWIEQFGTHSDFKGIAVRAASEAREVLDLREDFHQRFQGQRCLTSESIQQLREVYPGLSETDLAMIKLFGVPAHSVTFYPTTAFLGKNLNGQEAEQWLSTVCQVTAPSFFVFLDQLLARWWLEKTYSPLIKGAQIINGHSAILPYARGMYAIENIARCQDMENFARSAGATIHYIDSGIDTGPIIKTERITDPFCFDSIWEVKAASFRKAFQLLIQAVRDVLDSQGLPIGFPTDPKLRGPNFNSRDFTPEAREQAVKGYREMRLRHNRSEPAQCSRALEILVPNSSALV